MNTATAKYFFTILSSKFGIEQQRLYQLIRVAERAYYLKDSYIQKGLGLELQRFDEPFYQMGRYYEALYYINSQQYDVGEKLLEQVAEYGPEKYRARAVISLGASYEFQGRTEDALRFRVEAAKMSDRLTTLEAQLGVAIFRSTEGDHKGAIAHLERLLPVTKTCGVPVIYYDYLNSLALEYSEVGRLKEAEEIINIVLSAKELLPNWIDTGKGIYLKSRPASRLLINFKRVAQNVLPMPLSENRVVESPPSEPAKLFSLLDWKDKMGKKPKDEKKDENVDAMDEKNLIVKLLQLTAYEGVSESKLRKVVKYAMEVMSEKK